LGRWAPLWEFLCRAYRTFWASFSTSGLLGKLHLSKVCGEVEERFFLLVLLIGNVFLQDCRYSRRLEQSSVSVFMLFVHILDWDLPQCHCYQWSYEG
jgi:hypothetical protein